jgi:SSS family solute:Na+ symporter
MGTHDRGIILTSSIALLVYIAVCLALLVWTLVEGKRSKETLGIDREALGTARYPWMIVALTVAATMLGPADALGLSQKGYEYGFIWFFGPLGAACAQIVAGIFFVHRIKTQRTAPRSLGDVFDDRFGNSARIAVGALIFVQAVAFTGLLILAGAQILEVFVGLPKLYGILAVALSIGVMTAIGGLATIVRTDIFQSALIIALLFVVIGSTATLFYGIPLTGRGPFLSNAFGRLDSYSALAAVFLTYFFGELLLPFYAQRALMSRTPRDARIGFILAGFLAAAWYLVVTSAGVVARLINVTDPEFVLLGNLEAAVGGNSAGLVAVTVLAFVTLLALTHSTFDAILNTGGTAMSRDFVGGFTTLTDQQQGFLARLFMLIISALGMAIPFIWNDLIEILLVGYSIWAPTLMPVFAWIILTERGRLPALCFWLAVAAGIAGWVLAPRLFNDEVPAVLVGVGGNIIVLLGSVWFVRRGSLTFEEDAVRATPSPNSAVP